MLEIGPPPDRKSANWPRPKGLAWKGVVCVVVRSLRPAPFLGSQRDNRAAGYKMVRDGHSLPQGRAGLSPEAVKAMAGRSPGAGGRPLRRRREMRSVDGRQRLRGTAALQAPQR